MTKDQIANKLAFLILKQDDIIHKPRMEKEDIAEYMEIQSQIIKLRNKLIGGKKYGYKSIVH